MGLLLVFVLVGVLLLVSGVRAHIRATGSKAGARLIVGPALIVLGVALFPFVLLSRVLVVAGLGLTLVGALATALSRRRSA